MIFVGFFLSYIKLRRGALAAFLLFAVIFAVTFALYRLPLEAVLYPASICAVCGAVILALDFKRVLSRRRELRRLEDFTASAFSSLPPAGNIIEEDYMRIINLLCESRREEQCLADEKYASALSYYTAWAHQIKTPIASMKLQLQNEDTPLSRRLSSELLRIEQYVEMVLIFLKFDSHGGDYVIKECELDNIVRSAVRRFSAEFIDRHLALSFSESNTKAVTDEKWLGFIVEQILSNALKYTPEGRISVYIEEPKTLVIKDTGIGIAPEDLPLVFEQGYTGLNGRLNPGASGIGLYLCKKICAELGHTITLSSQPGVGTEVRIDLSQNRFSGE